MSALLGLYRRCFGYAKVRAQLGLALLLALAVLASWQRAAPLWCIVGFGSWIPFEYVLHRWILHARRPSAASPRLRRAFDAMHHDHHVAPDDLDQLFISQKGSIALALLAGLFGAALGGPVAAAGVAFGFCVAMIQYGVAHLAAHTDYAPRTAHGAAMKRAHLLHHARDSRRHFGVLSGLFDRVAGTGDR